MAFVLILVAPILADSPYSKIIGTIAELGREPLYNLQNAFRGDLLWCGVHDVAPFPEALSSVYPSLDNCCRQHDQCPLIVDRGKCWKGICNKSLLFPILSCDCEQQFRQCLDAIAYNSRDSSFIYAPVTVSESKLSESVGFGYFSVAPKLADRQCIQKARPLMGCAENFNGYCTKFVFNEKRPMRWQLFRLQDLDRAGLLF